MWNRINFSQTVLQNLYIGLAALVRLCTLKLQFIKKICSCICYCNWCTLWLLSMILHETNPTRIAQAFTLKNDTHKIYDWYNKSEFIILFYIDYYYYYVRSNALCCNCLVLKYASCLLWEELFFMLTVLAQEVIFKPLYFQINWWLSLHIPAICEVRIKKVIIFVLY